MMKYKGSREAAVAALVDIADQNPQHVFVSADSMAAARATEYANRYPDRFYEIGISEQGALDVCAGLASAGLTPFVATYAGFITMRACEQVRTFIAYPNLNVKMIGLNAGLIGGEREGVTHQFYEDIAILRAIPNVTIVCPCDADQAYAATRAVAEETTGPAYIRVGSGKEPLVLPADAPKFELGKIRVLKRYGKDVTIFTHGFIMGEALAAVEKLHAEGVNATLVEVHTLNPVDVDGILAALEGCKKAITLEDHNVNGALGSIVAEIIAEHGVDAKLTRMGLRTFGESGNPADLIKAYGLDSDSVVATAKEM